MEGGWKIHKTSQPTTQRSRIFMKKRKPKMGKLKRYQKQSVCFGVVCEKIFVIIKIKTRFLFHGSRMCEDWGRGGWKIHKASKPPLRECSMQSNRDCDTLHWPEHAHWVHWVHWVYRAVYALCWMHMPFPWIKGRSLNTSLNQMLTYCDKFQHYFIK